MSDPSFEHQLGRLFAEQPTFPDQPAFTAAVQARLERGWTVRRLMIGAAGSVGGLIAAVQIVHADLVHRSGSASHTADDRAHDLAAELIARSQAALHLQTLPFGGEVVWMVAGLGAVGLALVAARVMDSL